MVTLRYEVDSPIFFGSGKALYPFIDCKHCPVPTMTCFWHIRICSLGLKYDDGVILLIQMDVRSRLDAVHRHVETVRVEVQRGGDEVARVCCPRFSRLEVFRTAWDPGQGFVQPIQGAFGSEFKSWTQVWTNMAVLIPVTSQSLWKEVNQVIRYRPFLQACHCLVNICIQRRIEVENMINW